MSNPIFVQATRQAEGARGWVIQLGNRMSLPADGVLLPCRNQDFSITKKGSRMAYVTYPGISVAAKIPELGT